MKMRFALKIAPWLGAAVLAIAGCVAYPAGPGYAGAEVEVVGAPPPPVVVEGVPPCPGSDYVWVGGAWDWRGRWVWDRGRWDRPPHPGAIWVPHRYAEHDGRRTFVRGGWR